MKHEDTVIYHNPQCGTSRNTLALIRNAGIEPVVIEYLRAPPTRGQLQAMIGAAGLSVRQAIREKGTPFQELGLGNPDSTDEQLLDAMLAHPILINRPFVTTSLGTRLCRPAEVVLDILPSPQRGAFTKEGGEAVAGDKGPASAQITVRAVLPGDFPAWQVLWDGYNSFYGREGSTALRPEITQMTWSRFFDVYEPVNALVAVHCGELVGLAHYIFHRSTTQIAPTCYLQDLFTAEAVRGRGIGRALIAGVYERAAASGTGRVYWQTHESNSTAMALYDNVAERSGFVVYRKQL